MDLTALSDRELFRQACHGGGAEPRNEARAEIERRIKEQRGTLGDWCSVHGFNLAAYFASRPIKS